MVNTVVTFENSSVSPGTSIPFTIKTNDRSILQRRLYLIIGIVVLITILIPTILSIETDHEDFPFHTLFIVHTSSLLYFVSFSHISEKSYLGFLLLFFVSIAIYRS